MRILYSNSLDAHTLEPSGEEANFPATNLQHIHLARIWRSKADAAQYILMDAGVGLTLNPSCVAIAHHNLTSGATIKIQGHASNDWADPSVNETITYDEDIMVHFFTGSALRFWRFYFDDPTNPNGYIEIGRLFIGPYLEMPPHEPAPNIPKRTTTMITESVTGQPFADRGVVYRVPGFILPVVTDTERQSIETMWGEVENAKPVFLVIWPDSLSVVGPIYCRLDQEEIPWQRSPEAGLLWQTAIQFKEVF